MLMNLADRFAFGALPWRLSNARLCAGFRRRGCPTCSPSPWPPTGLADGFGPGGAALRRSRPLARPRVSIHPRDKVGPRLPDTQGFGGLYVPSVVGRNELTAMNVLEREPSGRRTEQSSGVRMCPMQAFGDHSAGALSLRVVAAPACESGITAGQKAAGHCGGWGAGEGASRAPASLKDQPDFLKLGPVFWERATSGLVFAGCGAASARVRAAGQRGGLADRRQATTRKYLV
jgi:hypothetical protein